MKKKILIAVAVMVAVALLAVGAIVSLNILSDKKPNIRENTLDTDPLEKYMTDAGIYFDKKTYWSFSEDEHIVYQGGYFDNEITLFCSSETDIADIADLVSKYNGKIVGRRYGVYDIRFEKTFSREELEQLVSELKEESRPIAVM